MKSSETDITFLNRLNSRDHEAFKQLFREYFQDIAYYSSKILKDTDVAEDVAQDVFIRLWEKENHFEIRHLPGECAKIMELVMQGYNSTEISTLTGASSSTVRSQKQRGISLLKKMVSPELYALLVLFLQQNN